VPKNSADRVEEMFHGYVSRDYRELRWKCHGQHGRGIAVGGTPIPPMTNSNVNQRERHGPVDPRILCRWVK